MTTQKLITPEIILLLLKYRYFATRLTLAVDSVEAAW